MSRLYIKTESDIRSGKGKRAHYKAKAALYWGSRDDSKLAAQIAVIWDKESDRPQVIFVAGKGIDLNFIKAGK